MITEYDLIVFICIDTLLIETLSSVLVVHRLHKNIKAKERRQQLRVRIETSNHCPIKIYIYLALQLQYPSSRYTHKKLVLSR